MGDRHDPAVNLRSRLTFHVSRRARHRLQFLLLLILLALTARLVLQPDPRDGLRRADQQFLAGHYHAALELYTGLAREGGAAVALRVGVVRALRAEYELAERSLRQAMRLGLRARDYDLALLYLGYVLAERGRHVHAARTWALIETCPRSPCPYLGPQRVLRAEGFLRQGDYAAAEASYLAARDLPLPAGWRGLVGYRLALLRAARDPDGALAALSAIDAASAESGPPEPFLLPLLPAAGPSEQLQAVLRADPAQRAQLLGQLYLDLRLYGLAEAQFAQVAPGSPQALAAAAYAAYTRWRAGRGQDSLDRLEELVRAYPQETRARTLLALAYLAQANPDAARDQIETIARLAPRDPDVHLAWASWYAAQRDYVRAGAEYQLALAQAPPADRGRYALLVARFHLATAYELCEEGLPSAELAARALPESAEAWSALAASRYHCGQFAGAVAAARAALDRRTNTPDAAFYLGASLGVLGDHAGARLALVRAADLAPASPWRARAEATLALLP